MYGLARAPIASLGEPDMSNNELLIMKLLLAMSVANIALQLFSRYRERELNSYVCDACDYVDPYAGRP